MAYDNLAKRVDLEGVKSVCMALQQAERYGTPMAQTLRVLKNGSRLGALANGAQRPGVAHRRLGVGRFSAIESACHLHFATPFGLAAGRLGGGDRSGDVGVGHRCAASRSQRQQREEADRGQQAVSGHQAHRLPRMGDLG